MKYLTKEELVRMNTKRILAYKRAHFTRTPPLSWVLEDRDEWGCPYDPDEKKKLLKDIEELGIIKEVLAHREHIERKKK